MLEHGAIFFFKSMLTAYISDGELCYYLYLDSGNELDDRAVALLELESESDGEKNDGDYQRPASDSYGQRVFF